MVTTGFCAGGSCGNWESSCSLYCAKGVLSKGVQLRGRSCSPLGGTQAGTEAAHPVPVPVLIRCWPPPGSTPLY